METRLYYDLLDIIEKQDEMITKQNDTIAKLINENAEKENMVNELMQKEEFLY